MHKILIIAALIFLPESILAQDRQALAEIIEQNGINDFDDERHKIEVSGCTMTTYRWRDVAPDGWVLWSSFQFNMADARLPENKSAPDTYFIAAPQPKDSGIPSLAVVQFDMRGDTLARFERSNLRPKSKDEWDPSPRNDGSTHYFQKADTFYIVQQGPDVVEKAERFTTAYRDYAFTYCINLG